MQDRYLFRGKIDFQDGTDENVCDDIRELFKNHIQKDDWVVGTLVDSAVIVGDLVNCDEDSVVFEFWAAVRRETVGQCTGFKDRNERLIFEGDFLSCLYGIIAEVFHYRDGEYRAKAVIKSGEKVDYFEHESIANLGHIEIIGNIHDNPQLIEEYRKK